MGGGGSEGGSTTARRAEEGARGLDLELAHYPGSLKYPGTLKEILPRFTFRISALWGLKGSLGLEQGLHSTGG